MAHELNRSQPLYNLLESGSGLLGIMPQPFARKLGKLFERNGMTLTLKDIPLEDEEEDDHDHDDRPEIRYELLVMDDSYFIAQMFSADPVGK
jgi:hypothetical protein